MTSDEARKVAEEKAVEIIQDWLVACMRAYGEAPIVEPEDQVLLIPLLATALLSAARVPDGCVREGVTDREFCWTGKIEPGTDAKWNRTGEWRHGMLWFPDSALAARKEGA